MQPVLRIEAAEFEISRRKLAEQKIGNLLEVRAPTTRNIKNLRARAHVCMYVNFI
jgi:hypothetical protein